MNIDRPTPEQLPALRTLWREAFGDTEEFLDAFTATALSADRCRCAVVDGVVAAALYWFDCSHAGRPVAYIYAVATAKAFRGRGICRQLMDDTHRQLTRMGYEGVILSPATEALFEMYGKMGYRTCSSIRSFVCGAAPEVVQLYRVDKEEYARLRRQLLPEGGVIQERENMDFLAAWADLYAGPGFLLAAIKEDNKLIGLELLGNESLAPAIVEMLGCAEGSFRTPGAGEPFAMYLPLGGSKLAPPTYFGLAFD